MKNGKGSGHLAHVGRPNALPSALAEVALALAALPLVARWRPVPAIHAVRDQPSTADLTVHPQISERRGNRSGRLQAFRDPASRPDTVRWSALTRDQDESAPIPRHSHGRALRMSGGGRVARDGPDASALRTFELRTR